MKTTLAVLLVVFVAATSVSAISKELEQKATAARKKCQKENSLQEEPFKEWLKNMEKNSDKNHKCFSACLLKEMGHMSDKTFDLAKMEETNKAMWDDAEMVQKSNDAEKLCVDEVTKKNIADECDLGYEFSLCKKRTYPNECHCTSVLCKRRERTRAERQSPRKE